MDEFLFSTSQPSKDQKVTENTSVNIGDLDSREIEGSAGSNHDFNALLAVPFAEMLRNPSKGSIIRRLLVCSKESEYNHVFEDFVKKNLLPAFLNPDLVIAPYVVFRLVYDHPTSLYIAEKVKVILDKKFGPDLADSKVMQFVGELIDIPLRDRSDFKKVFLKAQSYHPVLVDKLTSLLSKK